MNLGMNLVYPLPKNIVLCSISLAFVWMQHYVISFQDFALQVKLKKELVSVNILQNVILNVIQHCSEVLVSIVAEVPLVIPFCRMRILALI